MIGRLRTALFVPGDRPDRVDKAFRFATDAVVVDLEDAVADEAKGRARDLAVEAVSARAGPTGERPSPGEPGSGGPVLLVRVNATDTAWFADDVAALAPVLPSLSGVVLPMCTTPDDVQRLDAALTDLEVSLVRPARHTAILPVVETAQGVLGAAAIAGARARVHTLVFGTADLSAELGVTATPDGDELLHARSHVALAAAAAGRRQPLDGPHLTLDDDEGLSRSATVARRLGYGGKAVIHPSQLDAVTAAFAPTAAELDWARAVDTAFTEAEQAGRGAIRLPDGTFVDPPVAHRARELLAEAAEQEAAR
jgi:citrate lyase subunit beta / citryl-CoA lyase